MLDLSHPKTPHVFAAARQLDLILEYLRKISYSDSQSRLFMIEVIRPRFVALRWLTPIASDNRQRSPQILTCWKRKPSASPSLVRVGWSR